ncbi:MAG: ABC transporter substrate-binding protein [Parafilimonas terrae]|nr:ABC transporter substrate-binding protein [Parafilimonas terrae]
MGASNRYVRSPAGATVLLGLAAGAAFLAGKPMPASAQVSDGAVRIGVLGDYGSGRDLGGPGSVTAAKLAAAEFGDTVLGKPIEILAADHQNKPDVASAIARKWFDVDHVDAITDLAISSVGLAVARLGTQTSHTVLVSGAATSELTGKDCGPTVTHWADDTYALATSLGRAVTERVGKSWYFLTVDYTFGHTMYRDGKAAVEAVGGKVVGQASFPLNPADFSSYLLSAQGSGAKVLAIASSGNDTVNAVKQAHEFGVQSGGMTVVGLLTLIADVHSLGLEAAQDMYVASEYYWDADEPSRAFARRFSAIEKRPPTKLQAATYAAVKHYLHSIQAAGTDEAVKVNAAMRQSPVDFFGRQGRIRPDGRVIYDLSVYQVKKPGESKYPYDYYRLISTLKGDDAFRPSNAGGCNLH